MKRKGIIIVIVSILLGIILLSLSLLLLIKPSKQKEESNIIHTGITSKTRFIDNDFITIKKDTVYVREKENIALKSLKNEVKEITQYKTMAYDNSNFVVYIDQEKNILKNVDGQTLAMASSTISTYYDTVTNKSYYFYDDTLYDEGGKPLINKLENVSLVENGLVYASKKSNSIIIDLNTKQEMNINYSSKLDGIDIFDNIFIMYKDKKYFVYHLDTKTLDEEFYTSASPEGRGYILSNGKKKLYLTQDDGEVSSLEELQKKDLSNGYYIIYQEDCPTLKNSNGVVKEDYCIYSDEKSEANKDWYLMRLSSGEKNLVIVLFPNGKILETEKDAMFVGDYAYIFEGEIYNRDGVRKENECLQDFSKNGKNYICSNGAKYFFLDNNLNSLKGNYDSVDCHKNGYCYIRNGQLEGVWYKGNIIIEPSYGEIEIHDNYIVAKDFNGFDLFMLGDSSELSIEELKKEEYIIDLKIEDVIMEYNLESMRSTIEANEELFKKYAYVVLNNNRLGNYKEHVLHLFPILANNHSPLEEYHFFNKLKKLYFKIEKSWNSGIAGEYHDGETMIRLSNDYKDNDSVIYHELIHFLDFSVADDNLKLYYWDNKYLNDEEFLSLSKEDRKKAIEDAKVLPPLSFILEGGAEYYTGDYFFEGATRAYDIPVKTYSALIYIFGYEMMSSLFFSKIENIEFYNWFIGAGKTDKEYEEFAERLRKITLLDESYFDSDVLALIDDLVELYIGTRDGDWTKDNEFCYIISTLLDYAPFELKASKYQDSYQKIKKQYGTEFYDKLDKTPLQYKTEYYTDGTKSYIILSGYGEGVKIEYDFLANKVINKKVIKAA